MDAQFSLLFLGKWVMIEMKEKETITQPLESISTGKMIVEFYCHDRKGFFIVSPFFN
jgi:hypothetical protein